MRSDKHVAGSCSICCLGCFSRKPQMEGRSGRQVGEAISIVCRRPVCGVAPIQRPVRQSWPTFEGVPDVTQTAKRNAGRGRSCLPSWESSPASSRRCLGGSWEPRTLEALRRRPAQFRDPLPDSIVHHIPPSEFELDEAPLGRKLRTARKGGASGLSGTTNERLRLLLASPAMLHWFFRLGEHLVNAKVPIPVIEAVRMERMTSLRKPAGGVRGIVVGDVIRRLVARTVAQQVSSDVEKATAPYQYALSTRAGCECVSHVVQALCEANPNTTIVSVDGVCAYDTISREAMMRGLLDMKGGECCLSVRQFYCRVSQYVWEDDAGVTHTIFQGDGGEQGDPLMPMLYSLGQHRALEAIDRSLQPTETLMAFLDDVFAVTPGASVQSTGPSKRTCGCIPASGFTEEKPKSGMGQG